MTPEQAGLCVKVPAGGTQTRTIPGAGKNREHVPVACQAGLAFPALC